MNIGDRVKIKDGRNPGDHVHKDSVGIIVHNHCDEKEYPWDFTVKVDGFDANGFGGVPFFDYELEIINDAI